MDLHRAAIVGLTGIGAARPAEHPLVAAPRSHAAAYHRHPRTELVAVCDKNPAALEQFRQTWHDVWPQLRYYEDHRDMLDQAQPDLFSVVTSDHAHADIVVDGAQGSPRAILCEKPIATTLADADRMIAACEDGHTLLSIEHTRRWNPAFVRARQLIRSGELGPLRTMVAEMFSTRAMLMRNGIHLIDLFTFFADGDVQWVIGELEEGFEDYGTYSGDGGRDPALEPFASSYVRFQSGVRAFFNSYKTTMPGWQMQLTCDGGRLELSDPSARLIRPTSHYAWNESELHAGEYMYTNQLGAVHELVETLAGRAELSCPAREARKALEITLAILQSHVRGHVPVALPLSS